MDSIIILAQAGSGLGDLVRQILGPLIALGVLGFVLAVVLVFIVRARTQRRDAAKKQPSQPAYVPTASAKPRSATANPDELPDLDLLVDNPAAQARASRPASPVPAPTRTAPTGMFTVNINDGGAAQAVEVVTILRDVVDGGLIIQMGGKTYRDLGNDDSFRSSFLKIMRELSPIVTQSPQQPAEKQPPATLQSAPVSEDAADDDEDMSTVRELIEDAPAAVPAAPKPAPPPVYGGQMPGDLPKFTLEEEPQTIKTRSGLLGRTKTEFVPVPELDIAGAIEAYLQHKLQTTPDFAGRSIHVHPARDGGVAIEVDGHNYEAVGDVTDDAVRNFLSATIQEWQQRHSS